MKFHFHDEVKRLGVNGAYFIIDNMKNCKSAAEFDIIKDAYFQSSDAEAISQKIANSEILRGFRELHANVGCIGKKFVSAPENLMAYFAGHKSLPGINLIVDIYNYVSLKSELAIGAHDISAIDGDIHLRLTNGT